MNKSRLMFLAGLVVGEGSFYVGFSKRSDRPRGFECRVRFAVTMGESDAIVLEEVRDSFEVGTVSGGTGRGGSGKMWCVTSEEDLRELVQMFEQIRTESSLFRSSRKSESFKLFKQAVDERYSDDPDWERLVRLSVEMNETSAQRGRTEEELMQLVK